MLYRQRIELTTQSTDRQELNHYELFDKVVRKQPMHELKLLLRRVARCHYSDYLQDKQILNDGDGTIVLAAKRIK